MGCDRCSPPPDVFEAELVGYREIQRRADGRLVKVFDATATPRVRFQRPLDPTWRFEGFPLLRAEERDALPLLFFGAPIPEPPRGPMSLRLIDQRSRVLRQWDVEWDVRPSTRADVDALIALRRKGAVEEVVARAEGTTDPWICGEVVWAYRMVGDLQKAIRAAERCAEIAVTAGAISESGRYQRASIFMLHQLRRHRDALALLDRVEASDRTIANHSGLVLASYYRGLIAGVLAEHRLSRRASEHCIERGRALGFDAEVALCHDLMSDWYLDHGMLERAVDHVQAALRIYSTGIGSDSLRAAAENNLGWILVSGGCVRSDRACLLGARTSFEKAEKFFDAVADQNSAEIARLNLAFVDFLLGDREEAEARLATLRPDRLGADAVFREILAADVAMAKGDHAAAQRYAADAVQRAAGGQEWEIDYRWRATYALGRAFAPTDRERAIELYRSAMYLLEDALRRTAMQEGRAAFFRERRELYEAAVSLLIEANRGSDALAASDRAQLRPMRDLEFDLRSSSLDPENRKHFLEKLEAARARRDAINPTGEMLVGAELERFKRDQKQEEEAIARSFDELVELLDRSGIGAAPAQRIEALLEADEALVEAFQLVDRTILFLVFRSEVRVFRDIADVLQALQAHAGIEHVYVVDETDHLPIVQNDRWSVSNLPYAAWLAGSESASTNVPLVIADPGADLPAARIEGQRVAARFADAVSWVGEQADRERVLAAIDRRGGLLHFAGHGMLRGEDPWSAYLALAEASKLTIEDIFLARARFQVVVLSGCETGRALGEERMSLAIAFLLSGTSRVVATREKVDDAQAASVIDALYAAGLDHAPAEAVQKVRASWKMFRVYGRR